MRRLVISAALLTAGMGTTLGVVASNGASAQTRATPPVEVAPNVAGVEQIALRSAARAGDASPTDMEMASSTAGHAQTLLDPSSTPGTLIDPRTGTLWSETAVYVVTMHGQFSPHAVPIRKGSWTIPLATATTLDLVIDAKSGFVVTVYSTDEPLSLSQLGVTVTKLG